MMKEKTNYKIIGLLMGILSILLLGSRTINNTSSLNSSKLNRDMIINEWDWGESWIIWLVIAIFIGAIAVMVFIFIKLRDARKSEGISEIEVEEEKMEKDEQKQQPDGFQMQTKKIIAKTVKKIPTEEICSICKLEIRDEQTALQCPNCKSIFHSKHLHGWLIKNDDCPVCNYKLKR